MRISDILTLLFWGLFYIFDEGENLVYIFLAATFHESAHIFFYYIFKAKIDSVRILPYGISASFRSTVKLSYKKETVALFAGPCFNLIVAVFCLIINSFLFVDGLETFFLYNAAYFMMNIIPIFPLDGGRILRNLLLQRFSSDFALKISGVSSAFFLALLFVISVWVFTESGGNFSLILISLYLIITFFTKPD
ncbi:MAG: hypothetical protein KHW62_03875 [Clostridiales bacterium]|nr:hypothetical protein [Clostridiales bacterium]